MKHDDWDWSDPWALLSVPSPPLSGSRPLLPSAGLLVGGKLACRQVTPGKLGCGLPLRGAQGPGQSVRASVLLSRACSVSRKSDATRTRVWEALELAVSEGRGEQTPMPIRTTYG